MSDELVFVPLGGSGEIGMNLNLFGFGPEGNRQWIIVDIGVTFGGLDTPGIEIIMPDTTFIEERVDGLLGIVLTHAHEDHMGALARLWPRLKCPVYATPFTMWLVKDRLGEFGLIDEVPLHQMALKERFSLGPFDLEYVTLTHSIPEPNGLAIRTPVGTVFHTGDWKIDDDPQIGEQTDRDALRALKGDGVLAMICDSTNVFSPGYAGSEAGVREELTKLIGECKGRGVAVASFASNVARTAGIMAAAKEHDRVVCLVGRSMRRMLRAAQATGMVKDLPAIVDEEEATALPQEHVLYLCTGSQGEPNAALSRIARNDHRFVKFHAGDVVIFSSKIIPGNEKGIFALQNSLADQGIEIVTEKNRPIHVSGHPCQGELEEMYGLIEPKIAIPVHGERRHLLTHADLARSLGVEHTLAPHNGEMIKLSEEGAEIIDIVPSGRFYQDGNLITDDGDPALRERKKMAYAGHVGVSLVYDRSGKIISGPEVRISGFPHGKGGRDLDNLIDAVADEAEQVFRRLPKSAKADEDSAEEKIRSAVRKLIRNETSKRAVTDVTVHRI